MSESESRQGNTILKMEEHERPRERLARVGAGALKDAELLAILFRVGTKQLNAVKLAEEVLRHFGSLTRLAGASLAELQQVSGIGPAKAIEIKAALELGRRMIDYKREKGVRIHSAQDVADLLMPEFRAYETERFICIELSTKNDVLAWNIISQGCVDGTSAVPRDVFCQVVRDRASAVIVAHNHPSGDPEPSTPDIRISHRLRDAAELLGIRFLDHVIIGDGRHVSLKERGLL